MKCTLSHLRSRKCRRYIGVFNCADEGCILGKVNVPKGTIKSRENIHNFKIISLLFSVNRSVFARSKTCLSFEKTAEIMYTFKFRFFGYCYITIDVLNEAENSPLHLIRYFYGGDRYAKE